MDHGDVRTSVPNLYGDWVQKFGSLWSGHIQVAQGKLGRAITKVEMPPQALTDVPIVHVALDSWEAAVKLFQSDPGLEYDFLADYTAIDESPRVPRFEIVLNLFSTRHHARVRLKTSVEENQEAPTLISLWPGANWAEREIWDMFGIAFKGHPDLRRILMDQRWKGHPLRKDYPLRGYQFFPTPETIDPKLLES